MGRFSCYCTFQSYLHFFILYSTVRSWLHQLLDISLFRRVLSLLSPYRKAFYVALLLAVCGAVLSPLRPYLIQYTIDTHVLHYDTVGLRRMIGIILVLLLIEGGVKYIFAYITSWLGQSVVKDLRTRVFEYITALRLRYFDTTPIGTSTTRTINDVEAINDIFAAGVVDIFADLLSIAVVLGFMFYSDWRLTLVCLLTFPVFIYCTYLFKEGVNKTFHIIRTQVAKMNAFLQEHISGMSIVQLFAAEQKEMQRFKAINDEQTRANIDSIWYYSLFFPAVEIIQASALGLMLWYGSYRVMGNAASIGTLIAFMMYLNMLFRPLRVIADTFNTLQMGLIAAERVFALLDKAEWRQRNEGTLQASTLQGKVEFKNVFFSYNDKDWVLRNVSFQVAAGKTLALVGATGAGKSSVINILNRFYDIQQGEILIDDVPIQQYELSALRRQIGLVLQDVFLFSGTILDNITLRNPAIPFEKVVEAATLAGAHEFIQKLPEGYHYQVLERGATLSQGQRQLISFVRALVYNPHILILDEATASIDTESEILVQQAMEKLLEGRTAIIIAHRLSTVRHADHILVLRKGEIVESGTHDTLLQVQNGYYRRLYEMQFDKERV